MKTQEPPPAAAAAAAKTTHNSYREGRESGTQSCHIIVFECSVFNKEFGDRDRAWSSLMGSLIHTRP